MHVCGYRLGSVCLVLCPLSCKLCISHLLTQVGVVQGLCPHSHSHAPFFFNFHSHSHTPSVSIPKFHSHVPVLHSTIPLPFPYSHSCFMSSLPLSLSASFDVFRVQADDICTRIKQKFQGASSLLESRGSNFTIQHFAEEVSLPVCSLPSSG